MRNDAGQTGRFDGDRFWARAPPRSACRTASAPASWAATPARCSCRRCCSTPSAIRSASRRRSATTSPAAPSAATTAGPTRSSTAAPAWAASRPPPTAHRPQRAGRSQRRRQQGPQGAVLRRPAGTGRGLAASREGRDGGRHQQLAAGSWRFAVGSWQLAVASWQLAGSYGFKVLKFYAQYGKVDNDNSTATPSAAWAAR